MSIKRCCVLNCNKTCADTILHLFPHPDKDVNRFNIWRTAIGGDLLSLDQNTIYGYRRVCQMHFEPQYHTRSKRLSPNAVPTLGLSASDDQAKGAVSLFSAAPLSTKHFALASIMPTVNEWNSQSATVFPNSCDLGILKVQLNSRKTSTAGQRPSPRISTTTGPALPASNDFSRPSPDVSNPLSKTPKEYSYARVKKISQEKSNAFDSCKVCHKRIAGFRYACVQCSAWSLCGACEARGEHAIHYVLRIPPHKTLSETQSVLTALRQMLCHSSQLQRPGIALDKQEAKIEDPSSKTLVEVEVLLDGPGEHIGHTHKVKEEFLDTDCTEMAEEYFASNEGTDIYNTSCKLPTAPPKRKMAQRAKIQTYSAKKRKHNTQICKESSETTEDTSLNDISDTVLAFSSNEVKHLTEMSHVQSPSPKSALSRKISSQN